MQRSVVTNFAGIDWLRAHLKPKGVHVHNIDFNAGGEQMHIDTTIAPIKPGTYQDPTASLTAFAAAARLCFAPGC